MDLCGNLRSMQCSIDRLLVEHEIDRWVRKLLTVKSQIDNAEFSAVDQLNRIDCGDFQTVELLKGSPEEIENVANYFLSRFPGGFEISYRHADASGQFRICIHSEETYFEVTGEPFAGDAGLIIIRGRIQSRVGPLPPIPKVIIAELKRWFGNLYHVRTDEELLLAIDCGACAWIACRGGRFLDRLKDQFASAVLEESKYVDLEIVEFNDDGIFEFIMYRPGCRLRIHSVYDASHREYRIFAKIVTKFKITKFIP